MGSLTSSFAQTFPLESLLIFPELYKDDYVYSMSSSTNPITGEVTSLLNIRSIQTTLPSNDRFYGAVTNLDFTPYIGSTVKLTVDVLPNSLTGGSNVNGAHLYLKQTRDARPGEKILNNADYCMLFFDNSDNRPYTTIGVPSTMSVVSHIQPGVERLNIGFWLEGGGNITFSNFKIEVVDPSTPEETKYPWGIDPNDHVWCPTLD